MADLTTKWPGELFRAASGCVTRVSAIEAVLDALPALLLEDSPAGDALRKRLGFSYGDTARGVLVDGGSTVGTIIAHAYPIPSVPGYYQTALGTVPADQVHLYRKATLSTPWFAVAELPAQRLWDGVEPLFRFPIGTHVRYPEGGCRVIVNGGVEPCQEDRHA